MLWNIAIVLLLMWLLGMIGFQAIGGFIHILLILAIVSLLIQVITGRRPL